MIKNHIFKNFDYLIYSPHKTATQTVKNTLQKSGYNVEHLHSYHNLEVSKETFISFIKQTNPNLIYITRNPIERLKSSYFQSHHDDLIHFQKYKPEETIISVNNIDNLFSDFTFKLTNNLLQGQTDSLIELSEIFNLNIITCLLNKGDYFYLFNEYFTLYILNFNKIITEEKNYLSKCLNADIKEFHKDNLTEAKSYKEKYKEFKRKNLPLNIIRQIKCQYKDIYKLLKKLDENIY